MLIKGSNKNDEMEEVVISWIYGSASLCKTCKWYEHIILGDSIPHQCRKVLKQLGMFTG